MKLRQIKFENIITIILLIVNIITIAKHYEMNGFYGYLLLEPFVYLLFTLSIRYLVKDIRTNPQNWKM